MKKLFLITLSILCCLVVNAQQRTKITDGVYLVRYGNTAVVEDDINNRTWNLSVTAEEKKDLQGRSTGEMIYELACGNKYTKNLTKWTLNAAIATSLTAVAGPYGAVTAGVATSIASVFYEDVCNYFEKNYR